MTTVLSWFPVKAFSASFIMEEIPLSGIISMKFVLIDLGDITQMMMHSTITARFARPNAIVCFLLEFKDRKLLLRKIPVDQFREFIEYGISCFFRQQK